MFKTELYRILSKKTAWAAMLTALFFTLFYAIGNSVWGEGVIDEGGILYHGKYAIARDKEIAAEFSGPLTEDTVREIWKKYGPPVNYFDRSTRMEEMQKAAENGGSDNFCNRIVAKMFGETVLGEDGKTDFVLAEGWTASRYVQGDYIFGYGGGAMGFWDRYLIAYILACLAITVLLSTMFSEDYACGTAGIILPAANGRLTLWGIRMAAGGFLASVYYWITCGSVFLQYIFSYGTEGLKVSCVFAEMPMYFPDKSASMGSAVLTLYLCGWFSVLVLAVLVCAVSANSRQSFASLVRSLLLYMGPFAVMRIILDLLPAGGINAVLHTICYSMPLSYPGCFLEAPDKARIVMTFFELAVALTAAAAGIHGYCRHQVTN